MCLILFAYKCHPQYKLIVAANRDEFYARPTEPAHFWSENTNILAGRDLEQMGTWMGITKSGRFAALTNYRDPAALLKNARSRGELVSNYLLDISSPGRYMEKVQKKSHLYNGFNLLVGDMETLLYYSKNENKIRPVIPGIHGLSNHILNTPWPKVIKGKKYLEEYIRSKQIIKPEDLFKILADSQQAQINDLPNTGIDLEWEKKLSAIFIKSLDYGTRSSTVLLIDYNNRALFKERNFWQKGEKWEEVFFEFTCRKGGKDVHICRQAD